MTSTYIGSPPNVFFDTDFTLIIWIKFLSNQRYNQIIKFTNVNSADSFSLYLNFDGTALQSRVTNNGSQDAYMFAGLIPINSWMQITFVYKFSMGFIYVNGVKKNEVSQLPPSLLNKTIQFGPLDTMVDEIKLYKGALNDTEILNDYLLNAPRKFYLNLIFYFNSNTNFIF